MQINPYLFFNGRCDEAIAFYRSALDAEVQRVMRYKECPDTGMTPPGFEEKVMHAHLQIGGTALLMSDGNGSAPPSFQGFSLCVAAADATEAERFFTGLADGGTVKMPLTKTFFAEKFGMLTDRFGVPWMVIAEG